MRFRQVHISLPLLVSPFRNAFDKTDNNWSWKNLLYYKDVVLMRVNQIFEELSAIDESLAALGSRRHTLTYL